MARQLPKFDRRIALTTVTGPEGERVSVTRSIGAAFRRPAAERYVDQPSQYVEWFARLNILIRWTAAVVAALRDTVEPTLTAEGEAYIVETWTEATEYGRRRVLRLNCRT